MNKLLLTCLLPILCVGLLKSQEANTNQNKFRQLGQELPTPNVYRTASGSPGHMYWQQQADYEISVELDDEKQRIYGEERITYHNNSPDVLTYLWVQLDQNRRAKDSDTYKTEPTKIEKGMTARELEALQPTFDGGFKIDYVKDDAGNDLNCQVVKTMMRVDLPRPILAGESFSFKLKWWYNINDRMKIGGRSGYEYFDEDDNYLYTIAQFFPRMAVYNDVEGWQNKQFLGRGEFTLPFGDYKVEIKVPADHLVAATGTLQNETEVLSKKEQERFKRAKSERDEHERDNSNGRGSQSKGKKEIVCL
jgi:hypothetical protein